MPETTNPTLTSYIERARKVLQHEQRTNHQDQAIKPGGLEIFVVRWADEVSSICKNAGLDLRPIHSFTEYLEGYRQQDPMQRAASLRAALATLNELEQREHGQRSSNVLTPPTQSVVGHDKSGSSTPGRNKSGLNNEITAAKAQTKPENKTVVKPPQNTTRLEANMSAGHTVLTLLSADITAVPGLGASIAARLHNLGIRSVRDLLFYFPREHRDYSKLEKIASIPFNELTTTMGLIWEVKNVPTSSGRTRTIATISDETGKLRVSWFNQPYLQKQLHAAKGSYIVVTGVKQRYGNKIEFNVRSHELPEQGDLLNTGRLVPTYPLTEGLHAKTLRRFTKWVVDRYAAMIPEHLPASIRSAGKLIPLPEAVSHIHYPENEQALLAARRRLAFDELFLIQLGMQERRSRWQHEAPQGKAFRVDLAKILIDASDQVDMKSPEKVPHEGNKSGNRIDDPDSTSLGSTLWSTLAISKPFEATLPFRFTQAQRQVTSEIFGDLALSKPMCRLLQGDVGSGKTVVAAATLL